ncbi:MAG: methionyl-tRNA formyltransferase, partial [Actinomycetia bacterium]|nr:methionyl-tRNA formyltransferase [Actinomycetes bacterium]
LDVPRFGWINLHFSLLPAWRGAAPVQRCLMAGATTTGVTTFRIVHDLDAGPVFRQAGTSIGAEETAGDLLDRLAVLGAGVLVDTLADIGAGAEPTPQDEAGASLAPKVTVEDARVDWAAPAPAVVDRVRGVTPDPGAWTTLGGERFKLVRVRCAVDAIPVSLAPGELWADKHRLLAGAGEGTVELVDVQAPGKPAMPGTAWARGARLTPGARLV